MDVLLIGGSSDFMNAILNKLNKEGHRCFVLTGSRQVHESYKNVYEKYNFPYDADCLKEIFDSVNPDAVVFTGAYDSNFYWNDPRKDSVRFLAGLQNIMSTFATLKKGRMVFLSSEEVFSQNFPGNIAEDAQTTALTFRSMALVQGEDICRNYHKTMGLDAVVLRLDHLYGIPYKERLRGMRLRDNLCADMCVSALRTGQIQANANKVFSMLHQDDAVEFLYKIIRASALKQELYHISSEQAISEMDLAKLVQKEMGGNVSIVNNTVGTEYRVVLSSRAFADEFGMKIFHKPEQTAAAMAKHIKRRSSDYMKDGDAGKGAAGRVKQNLLHILRASIPFIENLVCFIPFFMLNNRSVGSQYFANLDFYLLYVLLFAIIHGQQQATFSAVLAVGGYCFRQMYERSGLEVLLDYNTYVWIAQLFILGLVVGYMKDQLKSIRDENEREMHYLSGQLDDIQDINTSNVRLKNGLEVQIVNQNDSFGKIYEITSSLDQYDPSEVLFYAAEILSKLIGSRDVAIYSVANRSYARLFSATSKKARELGNSVNYTSFGEMYEALKEKRVFINRNMDEKYPLMADAIYSEDDMQLILMVWGIPWERMTLSQANMLVVIGYLIQNAVVRANRYLEALENQRYIEGTKILETSAFTELVAAYLRARNKSLTECAILRIDVEPEGQEEAAAALAKLMRQSDYIGKLEDGNLYALLSNTENKDADFVIRRFAEVGYRSWIKEDT